MKRLLFLQTQFILIFISSVLLKTKVLHSQSNSLICPRTRCKITLRCKNAFIKLKCSSGLFHSIRNMFHHFLSQVLMLKPLFEQTDQSQKPAKCSKCLTGLISNH